MKVSELEGAELDYWVNETLGFSRVNVPSYSIDWNQAGPIIERETIQLNPGNAFPNCTVWWAKHPAHGWSIISSGKTPLIAAMRAFVTSKFGEEIGE